MTTPKADDYVLVVGQETDGSWRVFLEGQTVALQEQGVVMGGTWEMACDDAAKLAQEPGFSFTKPNALWTPSPALTDHRGRTIG